MRFGLPARSPSRLLLTALAVVGVSACSDQTPDSPTAPPAEAARGTPGPDLRAALAAQARHSARLMATRGVVGTAVGLDRAGRAAVKIFTAEPSVASLPGELDGVPVTVEVTGRAYALSDPTTRVRPAWVGFSVGHPDITAGTIGARVRDAAGNVYLLSNNHVLANANNAQLDDSALQPGPIDGGSDPADRIGGLTAFEPLQLGFMGYGTDPPTNYIDAAIARSSTSLLSNSTPTDDGYGVPSGTIVGDGNGDGVIDNESQLLGRAVQKYGRTTKLTQGQVSEVNVTIDVCYDIFCFTAGRFLDQVGICCAGFSDGGDSGSLIVTGDANKNPVALLFAGGDNRTFANRIDVVLNRFNVTIDATAGPPPPPPPDATMHVGDLDGATSIQGRTWTASITIRVHDGAHAAVSGATVTGSFSGAAKGTASCTTGAAGTCFVTKTRLKNASLTFAVTGIARTGRTYQSSANHDPDGDSNGKSITVTRP
jgi:hypothetical protein